MKEKKIVIKKANVKIVDPTITQVANSSKKSKFIIRSRDVDPKPKQIFDEVPEDQNSDQQFLL